MMTNRDIARTFRDLAEIMELYEENPFKIKSYQNAYISLRKIEQPLADLDAAELSAIPGVGKAISEKIVELVSTGKLALLEQYREKTPVGIQELLTVPGLGPKKLRVLWTELGIESIGELQYAINENRLLELKGFGKKTQADLAEKLVFFQKSRHQFLYAILEPEALRLDEAFRQLLPEEIPLSFAGAFRRRHPIQEEISWLIGDRSALPLLANAALFTVLEQQEDRLRGVSPEGYPLSIYFTDAGSFGSKLFKYTGSDEFLKAFVAGKPGLDFRGLQNEEDVFALAGLPFLLPELRENAASLTPPYPASLIVEAHIRGVIHCHTTDSDGLHSLAEMADYARSLGYEYIGITDHSRSAFYANGLSEERVLAQWAAIDALNQQYHDFRILKGIECDILSDGRLDYRNELLAGFDFVIASVHANLRMDNDKATRRLIGAIENPYTTILGHPTGRILLSRQGYPLDYVKIIDACAANGVSIELNANPYRLDIDWTWIPYAREKGVAISINPDAHSREGIRDIRYGVMAARKGGLSPADCLNTRPWEDFLRRQSVGG
jgi:DNA polymerase (family 10)